MPALRASYAALVVLVLVVAAYCGITDAEDAAKLLTDQILNTEVGGVATRSLRKGQQHRKDEEREFGGKIRAILRSNRAPKIPTLKISKKNPLIESLERNPTIKSLANNPRNEIALTNENVKKMETAMNEVPGATQYFKDIVKIILIVVLGYGLAAIPVGLFLFLLGQGMRG